MSTHTPGPWRYEADLDESAAFEGKIQNSFFIYAPDHPDWDASPGEVTMLTAKKGKFQEVLIGSITHKANARLIAAAPLLLELLKEAEALLDLRSVADMDSKNRARSVEVQSKVKRLIQHIEEAG